MNTRYILKIVDFALQVLSVLIPIAMAAVTDNGGYIYGIYFSLGSVQFSSCLLNRLFLGKQNRSKMRLFYEIILTSYTIAGLLFYVYSNNNGYNNQTGIYNVIGTLEIYSIYILALTSPFLGIWYGIISFTEIRKVSYNKEG